MSDLVEKVENILINFMDDSSISYDWYHTLRVKAVAESLALEELNVDMEVVSLAALLQDIGNAKYYNGDKEEGLKLVREILNEVKVRPSKSAHVIDIINNMFFSGAGVKTPMRSIEGKIVQDAERLDNIGAIGIARCFSEGGKLGKKYFDPDYIPHKHVSKEAFFASKSDSLNSFHEIFYNYSENMNTQAGKKLAVKRIKFMKKFESQFHTEWMGQDLDPILMKLKEKSPWADPSFKMFILLIAEAFKDPIKFEKINIDDYEFNNNLNDDNSIGEDEKK